MDRVKPQIVLWGATGFTGRLVAQALDGTPEAVDVVLAGRNAEKLEALAQNMTRAMNWRVAEASDPSSLAQLIDGAAVVITTVGPYRAYGFALAKACAEAGVDYVDLCGETPFIRQCIDELSDTAQASGARLVHACGFDSIPSDLGVLALHHELLERTDTGLAAAQLTVRGMKGGLSGGTFASMLGLVQDAVKDRALRKVLVDPYSLNPEGLRQGPDGRDGTAARYDSDLSRWTAPFIMAAINTRVVRRSNALLGFPYSKDFRYGEAMACRSKFHAKTTAAGLTAFTVGTAMAPSRWLIKKLLPKPGQGPNEAQRKGGYFRLDLVGRSAVDGPVSGRLRVSGQGDPGYSQTAVMLSQAALHLASGAVDVPGGIHTPASALGLGLVERLNQAGITFEWLDPKT
jgi:short subunit dehydrogenase-like uncharacterized protein